MTVSLCSLNAKGKKNPRAKNCAVREDKNSSLDYAQKTPHVISSKPLIQDELQKISFNCHYEGLK